MPAGHLNRPFAQYHAARGAALLADTTAALAFLRQAWDEGIEALMISFTEFDSAFDAISDSREFRHVMGLAAEMELSVQSFGGSVHLIRGAGSNAIAQVGGDGLLLVDTGYTPALTALRHALGLAGVAAMAGLSALAVWPVTSLARNKLGGQTGDVIGACQQVAEIAGLLGLVAAMAP